MENRAVPNLLLKSAREERFWTQEELARLVGTSSLDVSRWERGMTSPSLYFRNKLCEILNKNPQELGLVEDDAIAPPVSATNRVGEVFADYRLNYLLAQGESADIYFGEDLRLRNEVVIKLLSTRLTGQEEEDFLNEARTVARLHHPHILRLLDFGVEDGIPYLVTDHASRGNLRFSKGDHVPLATVVSYVEQVAEALQYAHGKGMIHRNIKPENLLRGEDNEVLLTDFGSTLVTQRSSSQVQGSLPDNLIYMAPELLQGNPSPASDQYALGVVVYEWLAGDFPTLQGSLARVASQSVLVLTPSTPQPGKLTTVSSEVEQVVLTALAQDPRKRFASVQAFANALGQAFQSHLKELDFDSSTAPVPSPGRRPFGRRPGTQAPAINPPTAKPWRSSPFLSSFFSTVRPAARRSTGPLPSSRKQRGVVPPLWRRRVLLPLLIFLLLLGVIVPLLTFTRGTSSSPQPSSSQSIVVTHAPDGESIGISDGTIAFDINRLDGNIKLEAADKLKAQDVAAAESLWNKAIANDTNDAEALIYLEDQHVLASGHSYITLVVGTILTGAFTDTGRASLQGAYVAQKEYNDPCFKLPGCVLVRLLVANAGSGDSSNSQVGYASLVMEQVVEAARVDKTIVGVMGWPLSSSSLYVNTILGSAGIPVVSPTASIATSTLKQPYIFSVAPSIQRQGTVGAQYAEHGLNAKRVALLFDPVDRYSESLANAFSQQFTADGNEIVDTENYAVGKPDTIFPGMQAALNHHPDLIYFAGHVNDLGGLLPNLPPCGPSACLQVLGGDALYELTGSLSPPPNLYRLHFTAYAYPGEEGNLAPSAQQIPAFYREYAEDFDPANQHAEGTYGYRRADSGVILSYDATQTLLSASSIATSGGKQSITPGDLQQSLTQITGLQAWQGVSGRISFGPDGTPTNKVVVVLHWSRIGRLQFDVAYGCFLKPLPTAPSNPACS